MVVDITKVTKQPHGLRTRELLQEPKALSVARTLRPSSDGQFRRPTRDSLAQRGLDGGGLEEFHAEYELLEELGRGEFSTVMKARQRKTGQLVAVKRVQQRNVANDAEPEGLRELKVLTKMDHPNVVKPLRHYQTDTVLLVVQEHCDHGTLAAHVATRPGGRKLGGSPECAFILQQLLAALSHCHEQGVVHRDLKLDNLMFMSNSSEDQSDLLKVVDFGNAKDAVASAMDGRGPADDVLHAGFIMFELISGQPFFEASEADLEALEEQGVYVDPTAMRCDEAYVSIRLAKVRSLAPPSAVDLLFRMLKMNEAHRITAKEALGHAFFIENTATDQRKLQLSGSLFSVCSISAPSVCSSMAMLGVLPALA